MGLGSLTYCSFQQILGIFVTVPNHKMGYQTPMLYFLSVMAPNENSTALKIQTGPRGYKTFFMLNSTEHENFPAHKC